MKTVSVHKRSVKGIISVCSAVLAVIICVTMIIGFTAQKESYKQKVSAQQTNISALISQNNDYRSQIVKNNGEIDRQNSELEQLDKKLDSVKTKYAVSSGYAKSKIAYLTFDDGPSENTLKILKVLKKYNIKATFFVTAQNLDKADYMKNIVADGHTIALHTYSHNYGKIYKSTDAYFADLQKIHDLVKEKTGVDTRVIRFPGGSSNTISEKYCKGIMTKLTEMTVDKGYSYFDWNCDSSDAEYKNDTGHGRPVKDLVSSTISSAGSKKHICVLMHDTAAKKTTADALPGIIEGLKKKGYCFDKLTVNTPTDSFRHNVNN